MRTVIEQNGKKYLIITAQYVTGLYVVIYEEGKSMPIEQTGIRTQDEEGFHRGLRGEKNAMS